MGSSRFVRKVAIGLLAGGAVIGLSLPAGAASAAPQGRHPLDGSTPRWLHQAHDMGASASSQQMNFGVLLGMRDESGAIATLQAISDPASPSYGQWLSNAAFDARYAPARASVSAVQDWLRAQGFQITKTLPSGMYVEASGSVSQVENTFGASLHTYSYLGKNVQANTTQLSLPANTPAAVTDAVSGVIGVDQGSALKSHRRHRARAAARRPVRSAAVLGVLRAEGRQRQAGRLRQAPAVRSLRVRAPAAPVGLRRERAAQVGRERPRGHGGDHRRLRRADDLPGRPEVQPGAQAAPVHSRPVLSDRSRPQRLRSDRPVRGAGLVRRRDPRRRGRAHHGARRQGRLSSGLPTASAAWTTPGLPRSTATSPT